MQTRFLIVLLLLAQGLVAQDLGNAIKYGIEDGFSSHIIYGIEQDDDGYIWLATETGLIRFNGHSVKNYSIKEGLRYGEVVNIKKDQFGKIWLFANGQLSYIYKSKIYYVDLPIYQNIHWNGNIMYNDSTYWFSSGNSLKCFNSELNEILEIPPELDVENSVRILGNYFGQLWLNIDQTIYLVEGNQIVGKMMFPEEYPITSKNVPCIVDENTIIFQSESKLVKYNYKNQHSIVIANNVNNILRISKHETSYYLIHRTGGFSTLQQVSENEYSVSVNQYPDMIFTGAISDQQNNLWLSTYDNGLYLFPSKNKNITSFTSNEFASLSNLECITGHNGSIYVGTRKSTIVEFRNTQPVKEYILPITNKYGISRVVDLLSVDDENLLVSSDAGVFILNNGQLFPVINTTSKKLNKTGDRIIINTYANTIETSIDCLLKIKEDGNFYSFNTIRDKYPCIKEVHKLRSYASCIDSENNLWIGNVVLGLLKIDGKDTLQLKDQSSLFFLHLNEIINPEDKLLYIATTGQGIIKIQENKIESFGTDVGLSSNVCYGLIAHEDKLFLATNKGLNILELNKSNEKHHVDILTTSNGLLSNDIKDIYLQDSLLYLINPLGINTVNLNQNIVSENKHPILIENIQVNKINLESFENITLKPEENNISFQFSNVSYPHYKGTQFAFKLEGADEDWNFSSNHEANYINLYPGSYTFKVGNLAFNKEEPTNVKSIKFTIETPFYKSNLAYLLYALLFASLACMTIYIFAIKNNRDKLEKEVLIRTRQLQEKIGETEKLNKKLSLSNKELQNYAQITSHDLKSPLRTISGFVSLLDKKNKDSYDKKDQQYMDFIKNGTIKMTEVVEDLLNLSKVNISVEDNLISIQSVIDETLKGLDFQIQEKNVTIIRSGFFPEIKMDKTNALQLFQNLIANAIKYNENPNPEVQITSEENDDAYLFSIKDNGLGIENKYHDEIFEIFKRLHVNDEYEGSGIGLAICKKIVEKYNGQISLESIPGKGSTFYISFAKMDVLA